MTEGTNQIRVTEFFEEHSANYGDFFKEGTRTGASEMFRTRMAIVADLLKDRQGALLDCATGTGEITQAVNASGRYTQLWANDVSAGMLRSAQATILPGTPGQDLRFTNNDIFAIEQVDGLPSFDVVLCLGLIAHVGRIDELFALFGRLLKPGGTVVIQTTVSTQFGVRVARLVNERRMAMGRLHRIHFFSIPEITAVAEAAGFRTVTVRRFGVCFPFGDKILGKLNFQLERRFARAAVRKGGDAVLVFERIAA